MALKILAPQHASKADFAERFSREAKVLAEVNHPHIVTVHDFGQAGEFYFLLMEFVDGVSLRQAMRAGRFTPEQALAIVPPICEALQFAHEHGIVHRDIKPENLLLDKEGRVKIADFGIARMMRSADDPSSLPSPPGRGLGVRVLATRSSISPRSDPRHAALHGPGATGPSRQRRPSGRHLLARRGAVRDADRRTPRPQLATAVAEIAVDARLDQIVLRAWSRIRTCGTNRRRSCGRRWKRQSRIAHLSSQRLSWRRLARRSRGTRTWISWRKHWGCDRSGRNSFWRFPASAV